MIDPLEQLAPNYGEKPDYAGLLTFAGVAYTEDPAELAASTSPSSARRWTTSSSDRPGTRLAPRAIRAAAGRRAALEVGSTRSPTCGSSTSATRRDPRGPARSHAAIEATVGEVLAAGARAPRPRRRPLDHRAGRSARVQAVHGPVGGGPLRHPQRHRGGGVRRGALARHVPCAGSSSGACDRRALAQIGLRGYWPGPEEFGWQAEHGITSFFMHDVRDLGIREVVARAIAAVGPGPVYLTVDVDVLDPAFVPGTGTPEPGGMTAVDLLLAVRTVAAELALVGADIVEVIPPASAPTTTRRSSPTAWCARRSQASRCAGAPRPNRAPPARPPPRARRPPRAGRPRPAPASGGRSWSRASRGRRARPARSSSSRRRARRRRPTRRPPAPPPRSRRGRSTISSSCGTAGRSPDLRRAPPAAAASISRPTPATIASSASVPTPLVYGGARPHRERGDAQRRADPRRDAAPRPRRAPPRPSEPPNAAVTRATRASGRGSGSRAAPARPGRGELCSSRSLTLPSGRGRRARRGRAEHDQRRVVLLGHLEQAGRRGARVVDDERGRDVRRAAARAPRRAPRRPSARATAWYSASTRAGPGTTGAGTTAHDHQVLAGRAREHAGQVQDGPAAPVGREADDEGHALLAAVGACSSVASA